MLVASVGGARIAGAQALPVEVEAADQRGAWFVDGVPSALAGFPGGVSTLPPGVLLRVDVSPDGAPLSFGSTERGPALNAVTDRDRDGTHAGIGYQHGSFGEHRFSVGSRYSGDALFAQATGAFDEIEGDYPVDVEVPDELGRVAPARVGRFNAAERLGGGTLEFGVHDRPWVDRLSLKGFASTRSRGYPHNPGMTIPYGEVRDEELTRGAVLRYERAFSKSTSLDVLAGYRLLEDRFFDTSRCVYDWFGGCIRERSMRGELGPGGSVRRSDEDLAFGRATFAWSLHPHHRLRFSVAPSLVTRSEAASDATLLELVSGIEYEAEVFDDRMQWLMFLRHYLQELDAEYQLPLASSSDQARETQRIGAGRGMRYGILEWLSATLTYEWVTELPSATQLFGDNAFSAPNLGLEPQVSHEFSVALGVSFAGFDLTGTFFRNSYDNLITRIGTDNAVQHLNVASARSTGVKARLRWKSPGDYLSAGLDVQHENLRNTSESGPYAEFEGDRIPQRPYSFADAWLRFAIEPPFARGDEISATWAVHSVHEYPYGWESVGLAEFRRVTPGYTLHNAGLGYALRVEPSTLRANAWIENLTDEHRFDALGAQQAGRSFHVRLSAEF